MVQRGVTESRSAGLFAIVKPTIAGGFITGTYVGVAANQEQTLQLQEYSPHIIRTVPLTAHPAPGLCGV